jgi:hypothetical protein
MVNKNSISLFRLAERLPDWYFRLINQKLTDPPGIVANLPPLQPAILFKLLEVTGVRVIKSLACLTFDLIALQVVTTFHYRINTH